jgi:hypothetical protein
MIDALPGLLLSTTPGLGRMPRDRESGGWVDALALSAGLPELAPLRDVIESAAKTGFSEPAQLADHVTRIAAQPGGGASILRAAKLADQKAKQEPEASFVLAWLALIGWVRAARARGVSLRGEAISSGGWHVVPQAAAHAGLCLGGLHAPKLLVEAADEALRVARRRGYGGPSVEAALVRCGELGRLIAARSEVAIGDLADELRDACDSGNGGLRSEVAALLWTLGSTPESSAVLHRGRDGLTRSLSRRLVAESMRSIPHDPLLQYVWLELKDRPELALRDHESLFAIINNRWDQWVVDELDRAAVPEPPSRVYAQTLVRALAGRLDAAAGNRFLEMYDRIQVMPPGPAGMAIAFRFDALRFMVGLQLDLLADPSDCALADYLDGQLKRLEGNRDQSWKRPELPRAGTRMNEPLFALLDRYLGPDTASDVGGPALAFAALERVRAAGLTFWLRAAPPLAPDQVDAHVRALLDEESHLISLLRGGLFLTQRMTLPAQFQWSDLEFALVEPDERRDFYSPARARGEIDAITARLDAVADTLEERMPGVGGAHRACAVSMTQLVEALGDHARSRPFRRRSDTA